MEQLEGLCKTFQMALVFIFGFYQVDLVLSTCRNLEILKCIENKSMTDENILRAIVIGADQTCEIQCYNDFSCLSYNIGEQDANGKRTCELSFTDHAMNATGLVPRPGFSYCPFKNPCEFSPCPDDRECYPLMEKNVEEYVCLEGCSPGKPLGLQSGEIPDSAMTSSSYYGRMYGPERGRLNFTNTWWPEAWSAGRNAVGEYLQVDIGREVLLTKVATQGRGDYPQWVTSYELSHSRDGQAWTPYYAKQGHAKVFPGNYKQTSVVSHQLRYHPRVRYVRIIVKTWHNHISLRAELYGCGL